MPVDEEHPSHLILGVLLTLRYLLPLLQQNINGPSLKGSFGVMRKEVDVQPTPEQLLQVRYSGGRRRRRVRVAGRFFLLRALLVNPRPPPALPSYLCHGLRSRTCD